MTPPDKITMLRAALERLLPLESGISADLHSAHAGRKGASEWMTEDDREQRTEFAALCQTAREALAATAEQPEEKGEPHAHGRMFTNEVGQHVSIFIYTLPSGQCELQVTRGSNLPQSIVLSDSEVRAVATISASFVSHAVDGKPVTPQPDAHAKLIETAARYREAYDAYMGRERSKAVPSILVGNIDATRNDLCRAAEALPPREGER